MTEINSVNLELLIFNENKLRGGVTIKNNFSEDIVTPSFYNLYKYMFIKNI